MTEHLPTIIGSASAGFALGLFLEAVLRKKAGHQPKHTTGGLVEPTQPPPKNPSTPKSRWTWHVLPGGLMELGDTGFYIQLDTADAFKPYKGYTPEHVAIAKGPHLAEMKEYMERHATDRAEFSAHQEPKR